MVEIILSLRRGEVGLDIVAALSMTAALVFGEELAAAVVALMYAGGEYLEGFAERHARREMTALLARVPRTQSGTAMVKLEEIGLDDRRAGRSPADAPGRRRPRRWDGGAGPCRPRSVGLDWRIDPGAVARPASR